MKLFFSLVLLSVLVGSCQNARILGIFPTPSISHQVVFRALMVELASRGHEIVTMTTDPINTTMPNYKQIDVQKISYDHWNSVFNFASDKEKEVTVMEFYVAFFHTMGQITDKQMQTPEMQKIINSDEKFDLVFFESFIPIMFPLKDKFDCPMILISSLSTTLNTLDSIGQPSNPALYPDVLSQNIYPMTFSERMEETYNALYMRYQFIWNIFPAYNKIARKHFGDNIRTLDEIQEDVDMMFLNVEPLFFGTRPTVPAIIYMGNMHFNKPQSLPKDIQKIMDKSDTGVIYFSLGSNVKSKDLPPSLIEMFLGVFKRLPYTVLWKFENETLEGKPPNLHIRKWFPQQDLLGHKNMKLFITQGGQQSLEEATHNGVPLIVIPFFADQNMNAKRIDKMKMGKVWSLKSLDGQQMEEDILSVVENQSYKKHILQLSKLIKDKPQTSKENAVWWTEYVLRHKGAKHLRSPSAEVPFYQSLLLDIIAYCLAVALFSASLACLVIYLLYKQVISYSKVKKE